MKAKPILGIATLLIAMGAMSLTIPADAASRSDIRKLEETGKCRNCDLSGADLSRADLERADLRGADLKEADLEGARLRGANLENADLTGAKLKNANLDSANLKNADLEEADLRQANLTNANLERANLRDADLRNANVRSANFQRAQLDGARLDGTSLQTDRRGRNSDQGGGSDQRRNNELVRVEFITSGNNPVQVVVRGEGGEQTLNLGGNITQGTLSLRPGEYRVRFQSPSSIRTLKSGVLEVGRNRNNMMRVLFDNNSRSVRVENDSKAWNSD